MSFLSWKESNVPRNSVSRKSDLKISCFSNTYHGERGRRKCIYVIVKLREPEEYFVNIKIKIFINSTVAINNGHILLHKSGFSPEASKLGSEQTFCAHNGS